MHQVEKSHHFLEPGHICFSGNPLIIQAVVGNGISVCLWDKEMRYGAMALFVYPSTYDKTKASPLYGNVAIGAALKVMTKAGCTRESMIAHILGGARSPYEQENCFGARNGEIARKALTYYGIEVGSDDTGGTFGRKVIFDTLTGKLAVLKVHNLRKSDWFQDPAL